MRKSSPPPRPPAKMTLEEIAARLRRADIPNARLEARWLLGDAPDEATLAEWVRRREAGEPLQYVEGFAFFMGRRFRVDERVLIPRPDTEILAERALQYLEALPAPRVLDLCTGSGALAVTIAAQRPDARVVACDISEEALCVARENAAGLNASFARGDLFAAVEGAFDVIVCNPPYLTAEDMLSLQREVRYEPALALRGGADGLDFYRRIARELPVRLRRAAFFEVGAGQARDVAQILRAALPGRCEIARDLAGIERVVSIETEL